MGKRTGRETGANTVRGHATAGPVEHGGSTVKDALDRIEQRQEDQGKVLVSMGDPPRRGSKMVQADTSRP